MTEVSGCDPAAAREVGADVAARGWAFAGCGAGARDVLVAPVREEAVGQVPLSVPLGGRAAVLVVVRGGLVEDEHARGRLTDGDIRAITTVLTTPLGVLLASQPPVVDRSRLAGMFAGLPGRYPRAWGALAALAHVLDRGGGEARYRVEYRSATPLPMPTLPGQAPAAPGRGSAVPAPRDQAGGYLSEQEQLGGKSQSGAETSRAGSGARPPDGGPRPATGSRLDPPLDPVLTRRLADLAAGRDDLLSVPCVSTISRRYDTLLAVLEFALAHGASVLTANYLLRPGTVHARSGGLVRPDTGNHAASFAEHHGLSDVHRACAATALASLASAS
jgi:hypothetical protein